MNATPVIDGEAIITGVFAVLLRVDGGRPLCGEVAVSGSKNTALALMAAAMLPAGETVLRGVPRVSDVEIFRTLMAQVGAPSEWTGPHTLVVSGGHLSGGHPAADLARKMRASYYLMGPMLGLLGRARVGLPGGCNIGARPIDLHFRAFEALGAQVMIEGGEAVARAERLRGADMTLLGNFGPSVGATINALLAAVLTPGVTRIYGAAQEPDVWEVAALLNRAGARVAGAGTSTLEIEGVRRLAAVAYDVPGDRIEAGTFLLAGAATGGDVRVHGLPSWTLGPLPRLLEQMGCAVAVEPAAVRVAAPQRLQETEAPGRRQATEAGVGRLRAISAETGPFPALATDLQPVLVTALCLADGDSFVGERVFEARFGYTRELERFGARIRVGGNTAVISGVERLSGAPVAGSDLRATAALVVAALAAEGESTVEGLTYLDRGYEGLEAKFGALGGVVRREGERAPAGVTGS